jgi:hypothetical protein
LHETSILLQVKSKKESKPRISSAEARGERFAFKSDQILGKMKKALAYMGRLELDKKIDGYE